MNDGGPAGCGGRGFVAGALTSRADATCLVMRGAEGERGWSVLCVAVVLRCAVLVRVVLLLLAFFSRSLAPRVVVSHCCLNWVALCCALWI